MQFNDKQIQEFSERKNFKGSILGYDQELALRYGLDVIDLLFFSWLEKFMSNAKMRYREINGNIYYNLYLSAFYQSMPICHVQEQAMKKRIASYIEKGLVEKQTIHTQKGNMVYIRFLESYWNLSFDVENLKSRTDTKITVPKSVKHTDTDTKIPVENSDRYQDNRADSYQDNRADSYQDNRALNNPTVHNPVVNNPTASNSISTEQKEEAGITQTLKELFEGQYPFDAGFASKLQSIFSSVSMAEADCKDYLAFVNTRVEQKQPVSKPNLFYKLALAPNMLQEFLLQKTKQSKLKIQKTCKVCGTTFTGASQVCRTCGTSRYADDKELNFQKQVWSLTPDKRKQFNSDWTDMMQRYPISQTILNTAMQKDFLSKKSELLNKYGLKEDVAV